MARLGTPVGGYVLGAPPQVTFDPQEVWLMGDRTEKPPIGMSTTTTSGGSGGVTAAYLSSSGGQTDRRTSAQTGTKPSIYPTIGTMNQVLGVGNPAGQVAGTIPVNPAGSPAGSGSMSVPNELPDYTPDASTPTTSTPMSVPTATVAWYKKPWVWALGLGVLAAGVGGYYYFARKPVPTSEWWD